MIDKSNAEEQLRMLEAYARLPRRVRRALCAVVLDGANPTDFGLDPFDVARVELGGELGERCPDLFDFLDHCQNKCEPPPEWTRG